MAPSSRRASIALCLPFLLFGLFASCAPNPSRVEALMQTAQAVTPTTTRKPSNTLHSPTPTPSTESASPTPAPQETLASPTALPTFATTLQTSTFGSLTVEEAFLSPVDDYTLSESDVRYDEFYSRIPTDLMERYSERREMLQAQSSGMSDRAVIEALIPFGYRMEGQPMAYTLYQGDTVISDEITFFSSFQVNQSKTDFAMLVTVKNQQVWLVQKNRFELYFEGKPRTSPIFIGDKLLTAIIQYTEDSVNGVVFQGDKVIYTYPKVAAGPETCPIDFFRAWKGHWVLQINGEDIMDGKPLGQENGYDLAFNWFLIDQKPIYLFQKEAQYGVWYDGKELPLKYDGIVRSTCAVGALTYPFAAYGQDDLIDFYAQKDGNWYFVQISGSRVGTP